MPVSTISQEQCLNRSLESVTRLVVAGLFPMLGCPAEDAGAEETGLGAAGGRARGQVPALRACQEEARQPQGEDQEARQGGGLGPT